MPIQINTVIRSDPPLYGDFGTTVGESRWLKFKITKLSEPISVPSLLTLSTADNYLDRQNGSLFNFRC